MNENNKYNRYTLQEIFNHKKKKNGLFRYK